MPPFTLATLLSPQGAQAARSALKDTITSFRNFNQSFIPQSVPYSIIGSDIMFGKLLMIKPRFESTNENQLTLESNLAVEVKIDSDGIKFPPNHRVSQMFDWQLVR